MRNKIIIKIDSELQNIAPGFIEKRKNEVPILLEALKKQDFSTLQTIGHKLKGNAGGYGLDHLGTLGAAIEIGAKEKCIARIEPAVKELEEYLVKLEFVFEPTA